MCRIVTDRFHVGRWRDGQAKSRCACAPRSPTDSWPTQAPGLHLNGDNLAYVIYTSGSTGQPKGVGNTHAALAERLQWMQATYQLNDTDVLMQKAPISFDVSVWVWFRVGGIP